MSKFQNLYVVFDPISNEYLKNSVTWVTQWQDAKVYKRFKAAVAFASLGNVSRNVPAGYTPSHKYQNLPNFVVHEFDPTGAHIATHAAPPVYMEISFNPSRIKYVDKNGVEV